jgi:branched-subunit amino acid transport protein AzlD
VPTLTYMATFMKLLLCHALGTCAFGEHRKPKTVGFLGKFIALVVLCILNRGCFHTLILTKLIAIIGLIVLYFYTSYIGTVL